MKLLTILTLLAMAACSTTKLEAPSCPAKGAEDANAVGVAPVVWDDARFTFLRFPGHQMMPVVSALRTDGVERSVNTSTDADAGLITVHGVYPTIVLRDSGRVACIRNMAYDQVGRRE